MRAMSGDAHAVPAVVKMDRVALSLHDHMAPRICSAYDCELLGSAEPFVLHGQDWLHNINDCPTMKAAIKDVVDAFDASTMKVVSGRAQRRFDIPELVEAVHQGMAKSVGNTFAFQITKTAGGKDASDPISKLEGVLAPSVFTFAAGQCSGPHGELSNLGCLRGSISGTRTIALISVLDVIKHMTEVHA